MGIYVFKLTKVPLRDQMQNNNFKNEVLHKNWSVLNNPTKCWNSSWLQLANKVLNLTCDMIMGPPLAPVAVKNCKSFTLAMTSCK